MYLDERDMLTNRGKRCLLRLVLLLVWCGLLSGSLVSAADWASGGTPSAMVEDVSAPGARMAL